ncbi:hypothetical protein IF1G_05091 [Cordyceps javanica]|uniref:Uncharacterized protein n=1 Tax=Cordyceps javanica TaxID=43265 RepID=A0A545V470_9HYPO|nr:hypothetical protein IF1G_05091 [Cordyceps javanica]
MVVLALYAQSPMEQMGNARKICNRINKEYQSSKKKRQNMIIETCVVCNRPAQYAKRRKRKSDAKQKERFQRESNPRWRNQNPQS